MPYVYCTASNSTDYVEYKKSGHDLNQVTRKVTIKGGAGIATKHLVTPRGIVTKVTDEELAFLMNNAAFLRHKKAGFVEVADKNYEVEEVVEDMTKKDGSSPRTPEDYPDDAAGAKPVEKETKKTKKKAD